MADFQTNAAGATQTPSHARIEHDMWIVVADKRTARILSRDAHSFDTLHVFHAPERLDDELTNDTVGRSGAYGAGRHKYEPGMEESRQVELELARDIANYLDTSLARREYAELAVIAPPQMLGEIRKSLPSTVLKTLVAESDKNMMSLPAKDLQAALLSALPGPERTAK